MTGSSTHGRVADRRTAGPRAEQRVGDRERTAAADDLATHAAAVALSVVVGHPLPPLFLPALLVWRRFA